MAFQCFSFWATKLIWGWSGEPLGAQDGAKMGQDGASWCQLGASWRQIGACWRQIGAALSDVVENMSKSMENIRLTHPYTTPYVAPVATCSSSAI